jgi:hypothetical protein
VPDGSLYLKARQLVFGSIIPSVGGGSVASGSSPFNGIVSDVILWPLLVDSAVANSTKYCYLVSPGTPVKAGFIVSPKRQPQFHIAASTPTKRSDASTALSPTAGMRLVVRPRTPSRRDANHRRLVESKHQRHTALMLALDPPSLAYPYLYHREP